MFSVTVKPEHLDAGCAHNERLCPLALACKDYLADKYPSEKTPDVRVDTGGDCIDRRFYTDFSLVS